MESETSLNTNARINNHPPKKNDLIMNQADMGVLTTVMDWANYLLEAEY